MKFSVIFSRARGFSLSNPFSVRWGVFWEFLDLNWAFHLEKVHKTYIILKNLLKKIRIAGI